MTQHLESEYNASWHVPDHKEIVASWSGLAEQFRAGSRHEANQPYGPETRNVMDIHFPAVERPDAAVLMFIHGGYWQSMDQRRFSHLAQGSVDNGLITVLPTYTLCPQASVAQIIDELRLACATVWRRFKRPIVVAGHSAGGHLAACLLATDWPGFAPDLPGDILQAGLGLSGLYDLELLTHIGINDALQLNAETARASSPLFWPAPAHGQSFEAWVGGDETSEFHRQSQELAKAWSGQGVDAVYRSLPGTNHYNVIAALADKESVLAARLVALARN